MSVVYIYGLVDPRNDNVFYIGFTKYLNKRYNSHMNIYGISKEKNTYKNNIINKIFQEGLKPEMKILDSCDKVFNNKLNIFEHERLEIEYIRKYRESGINLTNLTNGGEGGAHNKRKVFQYDVNGKFIKQYSTVKEIADEYGVIISTPSHALNQRDRKLFKGTCLFTSHKKAKEFDFNKSHKKIVQYTLDGKLLCEYNSQVEASRKTNIPDSAINTCLKGRYKQSYNYYWFYSDDIPKEIEKYVGRYSRMVKPILQYDLNNNLIAEFKSINEAARFLNISCAGNIVMNLKGINKTCKGFIWKYKNTINNKLN